MNILHMVTVRSAGRDEYAYHMGYVCCFVVVSPTQIHSRTINVKCRQEKQQQSVPTSQQTPINTFHLVTVRSAGHDRYYMPNSSYHMGYACCLVIVSSIWIHSQTTVASYTSTLTQEAVVEISFAFPRCISARSTIQFKRILLIILIIYLQKWQSMVAALQHL